MHLNRTRTVCRYFLPAASGVLLLGIAAFNGLPTAAQSAEQPQPSTPSDQPVSFTKAIQPILAKRCYACHGPDVAESGLRLNDKSGAFAAADSGDHAIVPGDTDASTLLHRIASEDEYERMPPEGDAVPSEEIALIRRWIAEGANWESHWAFEPVQQVEVPAVDNDLWSENPIDAFVYARLNSAGLAPNPIADKRTLVRRAYFDLLGLPPTEEQINEFVNDDAADAWPRLIDGLLASHHYGERWGRHWLDLVRYAETNSYERDNPKPNAWKYRDYVIRSFNEDKPFDQFTMEQLAGDELDQVTKESLIATGYFRLGIWDDEPADPLQAKYDEFDDLITTTGQAFLGLTVNCARCHDHKIDPISQGDYYGMLAFFADVTEYGTRGDQSGNNQIEVSAENVKNAYRRIDREQRRVNERMKELEQEGIAKMPAPDQRATEGPAEERKKVLKEKLGQYLDKQQWDEYQALEASRTALEKERRELPEREYVLGLAQAEAHPAETHILLRGNPHVPGDVVGPQFPALFETPAPQLSSADPSAKTAGRRRVFAQWVVNPENRLTSRVLANRLWQFHFGRGIVRSSNNFGQLGTPPTHPLLLDYLAQRLVDGGWRLKDMHRLIMTSQAYQQSSQANPAGLAQDPNNDLFWRFDPRRLSAEEVRDGILATTGHLNPTPYGPSFYPKLSAEVLAGQSRPGAGWGNSSEHERNRRSVYIHVKRSLLTPMLSAFDYPEPDRTCEARFATLQPGQALALMNSDFIDVQSQRLATRVREAVGDDEGKQINQAIQYVLGRAATSTEIEAGRDLMQEMQTKFGVSKDESLKLFCLTVLNWNEFLFVE